MQDIRVEIFEDVVNEMAETRKKKNKDYGNSFTKVREEFPNSVLIRLSDKLERLKTIYENDELEVSDETVEDTLKDLANYAIMEIIERRLDSAYEEVLDKLDERAERNENIDDYNEDGYTEQEEEIYNKLHKLFGDDTGVEIVFVYDKDKE